MNKSGKYFFAFILIVVITCTIFFISCSGRGNTQKLPEVPVTETKDSGFLFDGKSLEGWEITNFGPQGPVYISGDQIILSMGDGCTGITWKRDFPTINYEVSLDAMRVDGTDFFCGLTFPVGKDPCSLIIGGWGGATVGLSSIDGRDASENSTTTLLKFENKHWYHVHLKVTEKEIIASIDSIMVVDFKTGKNKLSIRPEVELSKPFGITSWRTTAALRNIRLEKTKPL